MGEALHAQESWELKASEWDAWIGEDGDANRQYNSDPVLWRFLGQVVGKRILDAGCGNGYLSYKLARKGASVIGIDWSEKFIELAKAKAKKIGIAIDFRVDSCSELKTILRKSIDCIVTNYVIMDLPDLEATFEAFARVIKPGGTVIAIFSHPCFGSPGGPERLSDGSVRYHWKMSYFGLHEIEERWGPFSTAFVYYHRPLSYYWKCFKSFGFDVIDFDEPIGSGPVPVGYDQKKIDAYRMTPYSVAFLLKFRETD